MTYHLHLDFENKDYFHSEEAWSTQKTFQGLIVPMAAHSIAGEKEVLHATNDVKSLIIEVLGKVDVEWLDWMTQKPTIVYRDDAELLISSLEKGFYINSFYAYINIRKLSRKREEMLIESFELELLQSGYAEKRQTADGFWVTGLK